MIPKALTSFYKKHNLRPFECTWLLYVHLLGLAGIAYFVANFEKAKYGVPFFFVFYIGYMMAVTGGVHRLWSHRAFRASLPLRIFYMIMSSGANEGSIYHWARDHRLHHKFSDTDLDPHSAKKGLFFSHVGWLLPKKSPELIEEGKKIDMSDLTNDGVVMWQKKYYPFISIFMSLILPTIVYCYISGIPIYAGFLLAMFTYVWILNVTWLVNSVCHMYGTRPWNDKIEPRDNLIAGILTCGEGYHNWHHEYPSCWKASKDEWWMVNLTARFIELMAWFKLATVKN
jgi:stearoyl-CoA desaturase (delta-9 desaturase)